MAEAPKMRARDAAARLEVSEAELVAAKSVPGRARALRRDPERGFAPLLEAMPEVGEVMVLTRNDHAVHERHGVWGHVRVGATMGIVANHTIDLRLFMTHWATGFAVEEEVASGLRLSLQFFDGAGQAVHKIYATQATNRTVLDGLIERWVGPMPDLAITPPAEAPPDRPDAAINVPRLRKAWLEMQDTHQFFGLLKQNSVGRKQALRLVGEDLAFQAEGTAVTQMLHGAAASQTPIMVFVRNPGCIQIHTGPVERIAPMGPWINVLDPAFNLHLRTDRVAETWIVRKPTKDGIVTSLEVFDADGDCFAMFFGARKPGQTERTAWRDVLETAVLEGAA